MVRILAVGWLALLVILSASKSLGYGHWAWGSIERFLGGNQQMHFVMAFIHYWLTWPAQGAGTGAGCYCC